LKSSKSLLFFKRRSRNNRKRKNRLSRKKVLRRNGTNGVTGEEEDHTIIHLLNLPLRSTMEGWEDLVVSIT
jgi:hypothetical protein